MNRFVYCPVGIVLFDRPKNSMLGPLPGVNQTKDYLRTFLCPRISFCPFSSSPLLAKKDMYKSFSLPSGVDSALGSCVTKREKWLEIHVTVPSTGSWGNVFVVRTSKPVENLWKNGLFSSRYSFVTHSIDRKPRDWGLPRSAYSIKYGHPSGGVPCASEDTACGYWFFKSWSGSDRKRRNRLQ